MYQHSLVILKPDTVKRHLVGCILQRFESAGMKIHAMRLEQITAKKSQQHYEEHIHREFYPYLECYITAGPSVLMVIGGFSAILKIRTLIGTTIPADALPGTIRGDFAHQGKDELGDTPIQNLVHASANSEDAKREIKLWFAPEEIIAYPLPDDNLHGI